VKPIDQLSLAEVELVVSKLHERVPMPQFELRTDQQVDKPGWGAEGPNSVCCTAEIRPIKSNSGVMAQYTDDAANADTLMIQTAQRVLIRVLQHFDLPTDEVEVPSPRRFFDGPPIDITGGMDAADYIAKLYGEDIPEFKRGACGCGRCTWHTGGLQGDVHVSGIWLMQDHFIARYNYPVAEGTYCSECGSLLGPDGWALLAGRDPKDVQWPEDATANREEDH